MDDIKVKRAKKSDKAKKNYETYGKFSQKAVRAAEELLQRSSNTASQNQKKKNK